MTGDPPSYNTQPDDYLKQLRAIVRDRDPDAVRESFQRQLSEVASWH